MDNTDALLYTNEAEATRYFYYKDSQEINFFVEDKNKEYEYELLFEKLFPELKINTIFSSGGKSAMENLFYEFGLFDQDNDLHPNIYIVDGDFDLIIDPDNMIRHEHYIYLDAYNIESLLFEEIACVRLSMCRLEKSFSYTKDKINIKDWYSKIINQSKDLFVIYCFLKAYYPTIKNVGNSPYIFIDPHTGFAKTNALNDFKLTLQNNGINLDLAQDKINEILNKLRIEYGNDYWRLICGKFVLTSLMHYLKTKGVSVNYRDLKHHFLLNPDSNRFMYLTTRVHDIIQNVNQRKEASC